MFIELSDDATIALAVIARLTGEPEEKLANLALMSGLHRLHMTARGLSEGHQNPDGSLINNAPTAEDWQQAFFPKCPRSIHS
jgi:hypothetical protein